MMRILCLWLLELRLMRGWDTAPLGFVRICDALGQCVHVSMNQKVFNSICSERSAQTPEESKDLTLRSEIVRN